QTRRAARQPHGAAIHSSYWHGSSLPWLEQELQRELRQPCGEGLGNRAKGSWVANVAVRQTEIWMVQDVEELGAELKLFRFRNLDVLERREVPVRVTRPLNNIPARVAELLHRGVGVEHYLLERAGVKPLLHAVRSGIGIADDVGPIGGESSNLGRAALYRRIGGVENGVRCAAHQRGDSIHLPASESMLVPGLRVIPEGQTPLVAEDQPVAGIKHRAPALGREIERILCEVIFAGDWLGSRSGDIQRRDIVNRLGVGIRGKEGEPMPESLAQAAFQGVVRGVRNAGYFADGAEVTAIWLGQRAARVQPPLVDIALVRLSRII